MKIYLDACCINRPFDDQSQDRIRLEAETILLIIQHLANQEWSWIGSDVLLYELNQIPDAERRKRVLQLAIAIPTIVALDVGIVSRANQLESLGFKAFDAFHIASAEKAGADILLTTDDRMLHLAIRFGGELTIQLQNPLVWFNKVIENE